MIGIPNRYMHTPGEIVDLEDLEHAIVLCDSYKVWKEMKNGSLRGER